MKFSIKVMLKAPKVNDIKLEKCEGKSLNYSFDLEFFFCYFPQFDEFERAFMGLVSSCVRDLLLINFRNPLSSQTAQEHYFNCL
jgi:hypothetical protein